VLRKFVATHRAAIIARAPSKAAAAARGAPEGEIERGTALFVDQIIDALSGGANGSVEAIGRSATKHGGDMLQMGFTAAQVVHEYGAVGQAIVELAAEAKVTVATGEFYTLSRCVDAAVAVAVTEHGRLREQAIAAEERERLGEFVHELNNSLSSAMISFDILRTGTVAFAGGTAGVLARSLGRLSALINSSVAGVRLDAGIRVPERISVRQFIEEVGVGAAMEARARNVTLAIVPVEPGIDMEVDRPTLAAAVGNLLSNAFKYGRPKGHVSLRTSSASGRVLIEVEDECGGLPAGKADTLFRPFQQQSSDRTGLGLGLSISRKSVEANGGTMSVRDIPGVGCVFTIDLPRSLPAL
jgi:signal transduction histidine kinase